MSQVHHFNLDQIRTVVSPLHRGAIIGKTSKTLVLSSCLSKYFGGVGPILDHHQIRTKNWVRFTNLEVKQLLNTNCGQITTKMFPK